MAEQSKSKSFFQNLPHERQVSFVLLTTFGIIALGLGLFQLRNIVYAPFALNDKVPLSLKSEIVDDNQAYLKKVDTDKDGLSDFDETNVYGTSAYLYDTFGYGISDREVVQKGLPLCPGAGKNCIDTSPDTAGGPVTTGTILSSFPVSGLSEIDAVGAPPQDLEALFSDPKKIRDMLLQAGTIDKSSLDKIPDKDLMILVNELLHPTTTVKISTNTRR